MSEPIIPQLQRHALALADAVNDLARIVDERPAVDLDHAAGIWLALEEQRRQLAGVCADLADLIARMMPDKRYTAPGVTLERSRSPKRTKWDSDDLLRAVLDARLVDHDTGEVTEHTPSERITFVWNLGTPRVTAIRALGLDPDAFCHTEQRDQWTLRPYTA